MSLPVFSIRTQERSRSTRSESGFVMIEMMLAVAIVGTAMLAVVSAFSSASKSAEYVDTAATAQWIATSQIELIRTAAFVATPGTYAAITPPTGFAVVNATSDVVGGDSNIQLVTVTVTEGGETAFVATTMKVNR